MKRAKLVATVVAVLALAPFSTLVPCFQVGAKGLAEVISLTQSLPFFALWTALIAFLKRSEAKRVVVEAIVLNLVVFAMKEAFMRPRPPGSTAFSFGYPSGHSARALWVALELSELEPRLRPLLLLYALAVGWSRIELCQHYPIDVIGGYLVAYFIKIGFQLISAGKGRERDVNEGNKDRAVLNR